AFSRASAQRIEASTERSHADAAREIDLQVFALYLQGTATGNDLLADFARDRFTTHFEPAFEEWLASRPLQNPDAAPSPFALDSYVPPGQVEAAEADARADALFARALVSNQRGDDYTLVTVLFALVLFFGAFAGRFRSHRASWGMVGAACVLLVVGVGFLVSFPKIVCPGRLASPALVTWGGADLHHRPAHAPPLADRGRRRRPRHLLALGRHAVRRRDAARAGAPRRGGAAGRAVERRRRRDARRVGRRAAHGRGGGRAPGRGRARGVDPAQADPGVGHGRAAAALGGHGDRLALPPRGVGPRVRDGGRGRRPRARVRARAGA